MNDAVLERIVQKPEAEDLRKHCPKCESREIERLSHQQTLLGSLRGGDPNHHWYTLRCKSCEHHFHVERKDGYYWLTEKQEGVKVLRGVATCFETYIYTCKDCQGDVIREHLDKVSGQPVTCMGSRLNKETGLYENDYRTVYHCLGCNWVIETEFEHWYKEWPKPRPVKLDVKIEFYAKEELGQVLGNTAALEKIDFQ